MLMVREVLCGGEQLVPFGKQLPRGRHRTRSSLPNVSCPLFPLSPQSLFLGMAPPLKRLHLICFFNFKSQFEYYRTSGQREQKSVLT